MRICLIYIYEENEADKKNQLTMFAMCYNMIGWWFCTGYETIIVYIHHNRWLVQRIYIKCMWRVMHFSFFVVGFSFNWVSWDRCHKVCFYFTIFTWDLTSCNLYRKIFVLKTIYEVGFGISIEQRIDFVISYNLQRRRK